MKTKTQIPRGLVGEEKTQDLPEPQWAGIFEARDLTNKEGIYSVLDVARAAADRLGEWRNWGFLTLQIQLAAERFGRVPTPNSRVQPPIRRPIPEEPESLWSKAKARIRSQISDTAFLNWFDCSRQIVNCGSKIELAVPDEPTATWLRDGYDNIIHATLSDLGVDEIRFIVRDPLDIDENAGSSTTH